MQLGNFSLSLTVKDIHVSLEFYQKLGFTKFHGDIEQNWLILKNGNCTIGLFQGMFPKNILTFNPGWDDQANPLGNFTDVRDLQAQIQAAGIKIHTPVSDQTNTGPGSLILEDPDGNPILIDQHV
ncbi:VOC family protein [Aureitalea marina]|uniref:Glyoxalase n=1 Tax=Aureitalea marina TaxID=930804 RepID=A0A2S7KNJ0_9FLAO|nr:VOC family protein [Aureitalea marina]PQB04185.1 glyoxalase [Aureitalea marina]